MRRLLPLILILLAIGASLPLVALAADATPDPPAASPVDDGQTLAIFAFPDKGVPEQVSVGTFGSVIAVQPGETVYLALGTWDFERCGVGIQCFIPVDLDATWSIEPAGFATIDPSSGRLAIASDALSGSVIKVTAVIEGDLEVTADVHVYTPEGNPLVGTWQEVAQIGCESETVTPDPRIEELVFAADGQFAVTWMPFESYVDYWGTYTFDLGAGTIDLAVTGGNHVPQDIDGQGNFMVDDAGDLVLTDLWLGSSPRGESVPACGHRFAR